MQKITPFLWFQTPLINVIEFYETVFPNVTYNKDNSIPDAQFSTVNFSIDGCDFIAMNGDASFRFNQSISFFVYLKTKEQIKKIWDQLAADGTVMMELNEYPFSEYYGWVQDKFGVSWQLMIGKANRTVIPCLLFVGDVYGKAAEAVQMYTKILPDSTILTMDTADGTGPEPKGAVRFAMVTLCNQPFVIMEGLGEHKFTFNEAISLFVHCETQEEVDTYWKSFIADGGEESQCGWLKDKFGVSWQIIPNILGTLLSDADSVKAGKAMQAMMKMKKIDCKALQAAFDS